MAVLVDSETRVIVQGVTGKEGAFHTRVMKDYGTKIVGGVTPGKGGADIQGVPVFDTVELALEEVEADASVIFVPPPFAADAICEAVDAGLGLVVCVTDGIPVHDMLIVKRRLKESETVLVGPNSPGLIVPEEIKMGILPGEIFKRGKVGVVSRSGTLTYQIVDLLRRRDIGQSACIGIGGDPIKGTSFVDVLRLFEDDLETEAVVLIGEIGGQEEERAAAFISDGGFTKPMVGYIAGMTAPPGKRMGHAGAIISAGIGRAQDKVKALKDVGVHVSNTVEGVADMVERVV